jgi:uncharacterized protein (DUF58 family)
MHLAARGYYLLVATAVLAIAAIWADHPAFEGFWRAAAIALLLGLAFEGWAMRRTAVTASIEVEPRLYLGRQHRGAFAFQNPLARPLTLHFAPARPAGIEALGAPRTLTAPPRSRVRERFALYPVRLGPYAWPDVPTRLLGRFGLAWWHRDLRTVRDISVAPDTRRFAAGRQRGTSAGQRSRRVAGAGAELHQLRAYVPGDPLSRIDWKATARIRRLISREFTEDQHLDVIVAIDAGRLSRIRAGRLDRLGVYANLAARFAEEVTHNDDRIGLVVFADRPLAVSPPDRGHPAVARIRRMLERMSAEPTESDPLAAAARIRSLLRHRSLVLMLTDLADASLADQLARAVRMLTPPHLVVAAGVRNTEIEALTRREASSWRDPWVSLAAQEHQARAARHLATLRRLGVPVVASRDERLERAVFAEYEQLRRARRI